MVRGMEGFDANRMVYCCSGGLPLATIGCELDGRETPFAGEPIPGGGMLACACSVNTAGEARPVTSRSAGGSVRARLLGDGPLS